jgi:hypothetical protein
MNKNVLAPSLKTDKQVYNMSGGVTQPALNPTQTLQLA